MSVDCFKARIQDVYPTGPYNTVEGYRAVCSCGWRTDLLESVNDGEVEVADHLGLEEWARR